MQPKQPRAKRTRIIVLSLSIFVLLALIANLGGCSKEPASRPTPQALASPTPTPKPEGTPKIDGDTPIVVKGGGSIDLDFDDRYFTGSPIKCAGCTITSVELEQIEDTGKPIPSSSTFTQCLPTPLPSPIPPITVKTFFGIADLAITSDDGVTIEFKEKDYPGVINHCGDPKKHHSQHGRITGVKVGDDTCKGCTTWKRCKVIIKYSRS